MLRGAEVKKNWEDPKGKPRPPTPMVASSPMIQMNYANCTQEHEGTYPINTPPSELCTRDCNLSPALDSQVLELLAKPRLPTVRALCVATKKCKELSEEIFREIEKAGKDSNNCRTPYKTAHDQMINILEEAVQMSDSFSTTLSSGTTMTVDSQWSHSELTVESRQNSDRDLLKCGMAASLFDTMSSASTTTFSVNGCLALLHTFLNLMGKSTNSISDAMEMLHYLQICLTGMTTSTRALMEVMLTSPGEEREDHQDHQTRKENNNSLETSKSRNHAGTDHIRTLQEDNKNSPNPNEKDYQKNPPANLS
jgi:hypothetical protein